MIKTVIILFLLRLSLLSAQQPIDPEQYAPSEQYEIKDSLDRLNISMVLGSFKTNEHFSDRLKNIKIYDISKEKNKSVLAFYGCPCTPDEVVNNCCRWGESIWFVKMKQDTFEYIKNNLSEVYSGITHIKKNVSKKEDFREILTVWGDFGNDNANYIQRIYSVNSKINTELICYNEHRDIPLDIITGLNENNYSFNPNFFSIKKVKKKRKKFFFYINYFDRHYIFSCDRDCFHCKIKF